MSMPSSLNLAICTVCYRRRFSPSERKGRNRVGNLAIEQVLVGMRVPDVAPPSPVDCRPQRPPISGLSGAIVTMSPATERLSTRWTNYEGRLPYLRVCTGAAYIAAGVDPDDLSISSGHSCAAAETRGYLSCCRIDRTMVRIPTSKTLRRVVVREHESTSAAEQPTPPVVYRLEIAAHACTPHCTCACPSSRTELPMLQPSATAPPSDHILSKIILGAPPLP